MLTIREYQTRQREIPSAKEGNPPKAKELPQKSPDLPVDEVVLSDKAEKSVKEKEYLVATYWG